MLYVKKTILISILLFTITKCYPCVISGVIKDSASNNNIPYVTFYLVDNANKVKQGISNEKGYFEVYLDQMIFPINISFKSIGYKTKSSVLTSCNSINFFLSSNIININQVNINELSAKSIVEKCLTSLESNLYQLPFNYKVFYRKNQTDINNNFLYSTEYFSNLYQEIGSNPGILNIKTRFLASDQKFYQKAINEGNWEIRFMLSYELYASAIRKYRIGIITKNNLDDLKFNYLGELEFENNQYYKISYSADTTNSNFRKGILYINKIDFSLLYFSSNFFIDKKLKLEKEFFYKKINNHYFLSHIKRLTKNDDSTIDNTIMYVNMYEFSNIEKLSNNNKSLFNTSFKREQVVEPDSLFWNGINYIPNLK